MSEVRLTESICLVSTFHDTEGRASIYFLKKHIHTIKKLFNQISLVITDTTSKIIQDFFTQLNIRYAMSPTGFGSLSRNLALKNGLKTKCKYFFYIDFDRLLYWLEKFPKELIKVIEQINNLSDNDYLVIGRTKKAWDTHPEIQQIPEDKTNKAISKEIIKNIDITPGCRAFKRNIAQFILKKSSAKQSGITDSEWLMIAYLYGQAKITTISVNGLSYETKLIYGKERTKISNNNYEYSRNKMADETIKVINEVKYRFYRDKKKFSHTPPDGA